MKQQLLPIEAADQGTRVDQLLAARFPDHSRSFFQRLIDAGSVTINGQTLRKRHMVSAGDEVLIDWPEKDGTPKLDPEKIDLPILYEDDDVLIINKPAGLVVHPGAGTQGGTLVNALLGYDYEQFSQLDAEDARPGIVHRLDKDTSGAMVVARTDAAKVALGAAFAERRVLKIYLALSQGLPRGLPTSVKTQIGRDPRNRKRMAVVGRGGKEAVTDFFTLQTTGGCALVGANLKTGRTHQIRVHMAHLGTPIVGDTVYGRNRKGQISAERQMLHAWILSFPHPSTGEKMVFRAPLPEDMENVFEAAGVDLDLLEVDGMELEEA
jgi:23S rRNA pseudouridine1911/1915/1917 synthase